MKWRTEYIVKELPSLLVILVVIILHNKLSPHPSPYIYYVHAFYQKKVLLRNERHQF